MNAPPMVARWDGEEKWRTIESFPAYSVSSHGQVRRDAPVCGGQGSVRIPTGVLKMRPLPKGHLQVTISMNNRPRTLLVHRLVAEAFLSRPTGKDCVCHKDDNPANNRVDNLFWGTRKDNSDDKVRKNRHARGERVSGAKLSERDVHEIRKRAANGENQYEIADSYGVTQSNISMIITRDTWKHV